MLEVLPHQETWASDFHELREIIEKSFLEKALAISHVGSTSIAGLVAKPIIDIQVSVHELNESEVMKSIDLLPDDFQRIARNDKDFPPLGYTADELGWNKHFVQVVRNGKRRAHIHVRQAGCANERIALLFRDFLQNHPLHKEAYGQLKLRLADVVGHLATESGSGPYVELKDPLIAVILNAAEDWARSSGWNVAYAR